MLITKQGSPKAGTQGGKGATEGPDSQGSLHLLALGLATLGGISHVLLSRPLKTRVAAKAPHSEKSEQALLPGAMSGSL